MSTSKSSIAEIDVAYVANLARIALSEEECQCFQPQLAELVNYVKKIQELDLTVVEPTLHGQAVINVMREDGVRASFQREVVLENAPARTDLEFKVPVVIE